MKSYIITYDLKNPTQVAYNIINNKIQSYNGWVYLTTTTYIIKSNETAITIRNKLLPCIKNSDELFVAEVTRNAAWNGLLANTGAWLNKYL